jgi:hypothetical protein
MTENRQKFRTRVGNLRGELGSSHGRTRGIAISANQGATSARADCRNMHVVGPGPKARIEGLYTFINLTFLPFLFFVRNVGIVGSSRSGCVHNGGYKIAEN